MSRRALCISVAEIEELDLLRQLYGRVIIPEAVRRECSHRHASPGEPAAISLAWQNRDTAMLIIDDLDGRRLCDLLGLRKTGTAGVLLAAATAGLVDFDTVMAKLQATPFRLGQAVVSDLRVRWFALK